jgi:hypothetical protein
MQLTFKLNVKKRVLCPNTILNRSVLYVLLLLVLVNGPRPKIAKITLILHFEWGIVTQIPIKPHEPRSQFTLFFKLFSVEDLS